MVEKPLDGTGNMLDYEQCTALDIGYIESYPLTAAETVRFAMTACPVRRDAPIRLRRLAVRRTVICNRGAAETEAQKDWKW